MLDKIDLVQELLNSDDPNKIKECEDYLNDLKKVSTQLGIISLLTGIDEQLKKVEKAKLIKKTLKL